MALYSRAAPIKESPMDRSVIWTIVGVLLIVALVLFIAKSV